MEVNLKREAIQYCTPVYSDTLSREETLETVVSDTLPDVARILDVDAAVYLRSKTLLQGSIRIEGSIRGTVLYIGEDLERLQRIEAELPVSFSAEAEGTEDTDILAANLCVSSADAKLLNPRKIQFRAGISAAVAAYRSVTAEIPTEAEPTPIRHAPSKNHQKPSGRICESRTMTPTVTMIHPTGFFSPISAPHKQSPDAHLVYYIVRTGGPYVLIPFGGLPSPFSGSPAPTDGGRSRAARDGSLPRPPRRSRRSPARSDACSP